jgi:hypothetical protein
MSFQRLTHPNGSMIAYIRTSGNGWQWLHKPNGSCLGYYRPETNNTFLPNGNWVGGGNLLGTLIHGK